MAASVGFECDAKPVFYDLTDVATGHAACLPIIEIDHGQKAIYENGEWQVPSRIEEVTPAEKVDVKSQTYWEQMGDKIEISEGARYQFDTLVKATKTIEVVEEDVVPPPPPKKKTFVSTLSDLWSKK
jgi:hypothetical protein